MCCSPNMRRLLARPKWGMEKGAKRLATKFWTILNGLTESLKYLPQVILQDTIHWF